MIYSKLEEVHLLCVIITLLLVKELYIFGSEHPWIGVHRGTWGSFPMMLRVTV